jgi:beta-galactosidase GanA
MVGFQRSSDFPRGTRRDFTGSSRFALALLLFMAYSGATVAATPISNASAGGPAPRHHTLTYDRYSLMIDGRRTYIWSGSFHYWRLPSPSLWKDVLQKMKSAGFNAVTMYFSWGYHSPRKGVYDFTGVRDVDHLLDDAQKVGLYVIARPGPYIEAESDAGGLPGWLTTIKGISRSTAPDYTADYRQWLSHIDAILARHQLTNGTGTVILYQPENEFYDESKEGREYMQAIERKARADGITVPFIGNDDGAFAKGIGAVQLPGYDSYPQGFDCSRPGRWNPGRDFSKQRHEQRDTPLYFPEFQGGSFDPWGGPGYAACRRLTDPGFERVFYEANIAAGATMQNFYMTFGGTSWGWLAYPGVYTSYDYGAAISESRQLTAKYYQQKLLGYFVRAVKPLRQTVRLAVRQPTNPALRLDGRVNPIDGTRIYILRQADVTSEADEATHICISLPFAHPIGRGHAGSTGQPDASGPADSRRPGAHCVLVPRKPGTRIAIEGRDSKMLLAHYRFGRQTMVYSTSQLMTDLTWRRRDLLVLYGRRGDEGETVLRYRSRPSVDVLSGSVEVHWDGVMHRLRLDYAHHGLIRVSIAESDHHLLLLIGTDEALRKVWRLNTQSGPVLVDGPHLVRTAALASSTDPAQETVRLTGDTDKATRMEVFAPADVARVSWNGQDIRVTRTPSGSLAGRLDGPAPVTVPRLGNWRFRAGAPEVSPEFDDSGWAKADHQSTNNPFWHGTEPVLDGDDYGFHHGYVWYRGHFTATGKEKGILLSAGTGANGVFTAWLNGRYLGRGASGRYMDDSEYFNIDRSELEVGRDNVVAVLVDDMGHEENDDSNNAYKEPRGLISGSLVGSHAPLAWRIQGNRGGETPIDAVRGPYNNGGLYGERHGWSLPGYPDGDWRPVTLPSRIDRPGVDWYRTTFRLDMPADQDVPVALKISDDPSRHYRALIFVNGWQFGRYINALGPEHVFVLPPGILNTRGTNTIAISSWSTEHRGGLGRVSLVELGNYRTSLRVRRVDSPGYDRSKYSRRR